MSYVRPPLSFSFLTSLNEFIHTPHRAFSRSSVRLHLPFFFIIIISELSEKTENWSITEVNEAKHQHLTYDKILHQLRWYTFLSGFFSPSFCWTHVSSPNYRDLLIPKYSQKAQLSGSHPVVRFSFFPQKLFFFCLPSLIKSLHRTWNECSLYRIYRTT